MLQTTFDLEALHTTTILSIYCPNCGSSAQRYHLESDHLTRTQCPTCDYLMVMCSQTGKVIAAYAPGIYAR